MVFSSKKSKGKGEGENGTDNNHLEKMVVVVPVGHSERKNLKSART
jgi:hypothetical protein